MWTNAILKLWIWLLNNNICSVGWGILKDSDSKLYFIRAEIAYWYKHLNISALNKLDHYTFFEKSPPKFSINKYFTMCLSFLTHVCLCVVWCVHSFMNACLPSCVGTHEECFSMGMAMAGEASTAVHLTHWFKGSHCFD